MKLIIDSNRIIAALIKESATRKLLFNSIFQFYAPIGIFDEILRYKEIIIKKAEIFEDEFVGLFKGMMDRVNIVPDLEIKKELSKAESIMEKIDVDDSFFIACGFIVKTDGIWTEDGHFYKQSALKPYRTKTLLEIIESK